MDLWDLIRVLVRRWWVTVPLLALTVVAAITLGGRESTTYDGRADYLLVPPGNDDPAAGPLVNPLSSINSTGAFGGLIGTVVGSTETRDEIEQAGGEREYQLTQGRNSPTLVVSVESDSADVAQLTVREVLTRVDEQIVALQDGIAVPAQFRIRGQLVVGPLVTSTTSSSNRVLLGVGAAGLLLTALAALAVEALLSTRRRRVVAPAGTGGVGPDPAAVDPPGPRAGAGRPDDRDPGADRQGRPGSHRLEEPVPPPPDRSRPDVDQGPDGRGRTPYDPAPDDETERRLTGSGATGRDASRFGGPGYEAPRTP